MSLPPYPKYRASGVEWLGEVPEHWDIPPLYMRYEVLLGKMLDEKRISGQHLLPYVRNVDVQWDRVNVDGLPVMDVAPVEFDRFTLKEGDLLVCEGGEVGRSAIWRGELIPCAYQKAIHRLRARSHNEITRFLYYCMRFASATEIFVAGSNPNTIPHLTGEKLRLYRFPRPPLKEQAQIAMFLDRETARIDALVVEQQRLIELLTEKRQAVISHAITKGLNPDEPMKRSGVQWLGDVPARWEVMPIRKAAKLESGHTPSRSHSEYWENCTVPWFTLADVWQIREAKAEYIYETKEKVSEIGLANSSARLLPKGTVMLSRTASVGFSAIMGVDMATTQDFADWICGPRLLPEFLLYVFRSMEGEFRRLMMGSTHNTIYMPDIQSLTFVLPPLDEQAAIVAFVRNEAKRFDELTAAADHSTTVLQERRTAVIAAAVTGKIDVRGMGSAAAA